MNPLFLVKTLARRGLLNPGRPDRVFDQLNTFRTWGYSLAAELRQAEARDPHRIAVIDERVGPVTYRKLLRRAQRLAIGLSATRGIGEGARIGIMARNHIGMLEQMVACSILGADAVLVNNALSAPQLATVAEQQELRLLLHDREFAPVVAGVGCEHLDESFVDNLIAQTPPRGNWLPSKAGRMIVLTSGTTGAPKGARRPTPPGLSSLCTIIDRIPLKVHDRILIAAPIFHTWGYAALQFALGMRATIVLQRRFEPASCVQAIDKHQCSALFAVPVMIQRLLEAGAVPTKPPRIVGLSGSALPPNMATTFMDTWGDCLYSLYGSTEASWAAIAGPKELRKDPGTAGFPPYGTRVAILDPAGNRVQKGHVGQIYVGNEMLFEGYTADGKGDRLEGLLGTGDLGHFNADGMLYVDGRADDMVISGGENVFPRPVEELLAQLPQIREVAVTGVPDQEFGQRLAAYVVLNDGEVLSEEDVRDYVRHYLARFSIPRDVHFLPELPRNATGKVVTRELR